MPYTMTATLRLTRAEKDLVSNIPKCLKMLVIILAFCIVLSMPYDTTGSDADTHSFDSKPFFAHSFKLQMDPYQEECVWQKLRNGTYLSFGYEVMRGGDRKVAFALRDNYGRVLQSEDDKQEHFLEKTVEEEGVYGFCMDNRDGKFVEKLVFFYLSGYVAESWAMSEGEIEKYDEQAQNITSSLQSVDNQIQKMINHQTVSRMHLVTDWYLISGNLNWVTYWSSFQSVVIAIVGFVQVFFIKRLFADGSTSGSGLLRASA